MAREPVTLLAAASFEERSLVTTREFLEDTGEPSDVYLANVVEHNIQHQENVVAFRRLGIGTIESLNRLSSRSLWNWTWKTIEAAPRGDIIVDVTCFPRELLGMLLFAISLRRKKFLNVTIRYIAAPEDGYATQNPELEASARGWLSKGVRDIRSIVGFPGEFSGEKEGHLIALTGHEEDRMMEIVEFVEPRKLSIGSAQIGSSTTAGADEYSQTVVEALRSRVPVPEIQEVVFRSDSVHDVYKSLFEMGLNFDTENISLAAMNTKISFVGAALFALRERRVRVVYAVPEEYNPFYSQGVGRPYRFNITDLISRARTEAL